MVLEACESTDAHSLLTYGGDIGLNSEILEAGEVERGIISE